ncbi:hypothetical protein [Bradyrhizobium sp. BWA-3-5]|uniref:hypothetical protein n=1 Tax=Bradyrhizobium sp. BWA-3-5 TaxID=3080013 RepID=UPI00293E5B91|nr:hypothetical protein [Bradyrhizobium sp. BWA-3-5]WOH63855.1 hypothetical protein RX331_24600 [Bradyrhizobium sp. BWA-3-5]
MSTTIMTNRTTSTSGIITIMIIITTIGTLPSHRRSLRGRQNLRNRRRAVWAK